MLLAKNSRLTGTSKFEAHQEIHIFLGPVNPDEETISKFKDSVQKWNEKNNTTDMKACDLVLVFRDTNGIEKDVRVIMSSRYFWCNDTDEVIRQTKLDADYFSECGFTVIREKIEGTALQITEIPKTDEQAENSGGYFEIHIRVSRTNDNSQTLVSNDELDVLKKMSRELSRELQIPVPLSYNKAKGYQRFLNVRFRKRGTDSIKEILANIKVLVNRSSFKHDKNIFEFVWYDTLPEMDQGWIDFNENETVNDLFREQ